MFTYSYWLLDDPLATPAEKLKNAFVWLDKNRARKWEGLDGQLIQAVDFTTIVTEEKNLINNGRASTSHSI